jgi:hypothetical protein
MRNSDNQISKTQVALSFFLSNSQVGEPGQHVFQALLVRVEVSAGALPDLPGGPR